MDPAATPTCRESHPSCRHRNDDLQRPKTPPARKATDDLESNDDKILIGVANKGADCELHANGADLSEKREKEVAKVERGWRKVIRNFTPSYVFAFYFIQLFKDGHHSARSRELVQLKIS